MLLYIFVLIAILNVGISMLIVLMWMFERTFAGFLFRVYPPGMDRSGIPGKWFCSELVFKGLVDYLSTED